jgi:hypothetical protein
MTAKQLTFFRDFLDNFWESLFLQHVITSQACDRLKFWLYQIEAGMCYATRTRFILFDYEPPAGSIPSDLGFALALRYRNYRQLFRDLYYRLPVFFEKNLRGGHHLRPIR